MNTRVKQAILKIILLQEEFTEKEMNEAIKSIQMDNRTPLIQTNNHSPLIQFLKKYGKGHKDVIKSFEQQRTKVIKDLKNTEPEKYKVLSEFDALVRKGSLLKNTEEIKAIASKISKDFPKIKSRKESIPKLMKLLVKLPLSDIKALIEDVIKFNSSEESEYYKLAQFIIHGK